MSDAIVPIPKADVGVRPATAADVPFIDALQKKHSKMVGFMPGKQLEGKIAAGEVLIAEEGEPQRHRGTEACPNCDGASVSLCLCGRNSSALPVGYVIGTDRYFKRDDVGIVYQLNVAPGAQRGFVGATLLKAVFDRAAYGCRLFCCWCAQDIEANRFWEAMGFVPLAYRAGSERKGRVHIFWQKRIRSGDTETPWWFPSQTTGGSIREDRLVLPIPPGTHWSDAKPVVLPGVSRTEDAPAKSLPGARKAKGPARPAAPAPARRAISRASALSFAPPKPPAAEKPAGKKPREKAPKRKNDPKLVAAARELRDRWLERVNAGEYVFEEAGKYDVSRALPAGLATPAKPMPMLPAA